jgi:DNA topoisomerase VI subunit B
VIPQVSTQTAGRFGVGLTLCILHSFIGTGGRTVIRSTRRGSDIERVCALVADVRGDKIVEVGEGREGEGRE